MRMSVWLSNISGKGVLQDVYGFLAVLGPICEATYEILRHDTHSSLEDLQMIQFWHFLWRNATLSKESASLSWKRSMIKREPDLNWQSIFL